MNDMIFSTLLIQSFAGAGLILLMTGLRKVFSGKVPHRLVYSLWLAVALRMLIPFSMPTFIQFDPYAAIPTQSAYIVQQDENRPMESDNAQTSLLLETAKQTVSAVTNLSEQGNITPGTPAAQPVRTNLQSLSTAQILVIIWLSGAALSSLYIFLVNRRFTNRVFENAEPLAIESPIPVYLAEVPSPCLIGVFRPCVALNAISVRPENLPFALAHELSHYRGMDHVWSLLRNAVLALFWFHPLVWLAVKLSRQDCERACDERVTRKFDQDTAINYAHTLIALVMPQKLTIGAPASFMSTTLPEMKQRVGLILSRAHARRWACVLLAGLMLLTSLASFATGETMVREIKLPKAEKLLFYPTEDGLWVAINERLYKQSGEDTFIEVALLPSAHYITVDRSSIYTLDMAAKTIIKLNEEGKQKEAWNLPEELLPIKIVAAGDALAILSEVPYNTRAGQSVIEADLYLLDQASGALTQARIGAVSNICSDGGGNLLVLHKPVPGMNDALISRLNMKNLTAQTIAEADTQSLEIAAGDGMIYINDGNNLIQFNEQTGLKTVIPIPGLADAYGLSSLHAAGGLLYAWDNHNKQLLSIDVSSDRSKGKTVLTIMNVENYTLSMASAVESFVAAHPDVEIRKVNMEQSKYLTALMAGDPGIDLIWQEAGFIVEQAEAGAVIPLGDEPLIKEALAQAKWLPFEPLFSYKNVLYGVPAAIILRMWEVEEGLAKQQGFQMPAAPYTWRDLQQAAAEAKLGQPGQPILFGDIDRAPSVMYYYIMDHLQNGGTVNFDTPGFREDMEAYRELVRQGAIVIFQAGGGNGLPPEIIRQFSYSDKAVPQPTVNGQNVVDVQAEGLCVSANSQNREIAIAFIAEYLKPEHQYKELYHAYNLLFLQNTDHYARNESDNWIFAPYTEKTEELRQFASNSWMSWNRKIHPVHLMENNDAFPRYMDGSITIDEFIRIIQARADMMQYE